MKDKFLCVLAQYDSQTEHKLKDMQKILVDNGFTGKQTPDLPGHITLGTYDVSQEEILTQKVKEAAGYFKSFDITLDSIGLFGLDVLFLTPSVNQELLNLRQFFSSVKEMDDRTWTAHTTLLIDNRDTILKALPVAADNFKSFQGRIESVCLYEFWPTRLIAEEQLR